ncbi:MAG: hypothetical protein NVSMB60_12280 [Mycobacterium sp.]
MAFVRERERNDGTPSFSVTYRLGGRGSRQSSTSFPDKAQADRFRALVDSLGVERALEVAGIPDVPQRFVRPPMGRSWASRDAISADKADEADDCPKTASATDLATGRSQRA